MVYLGIDLGGTNIKVAAVDESCTILAEANRDTQMERGPEAICDDIAAAMCETAARLGLQLSDVAGLGVGCPGTIDNDTGIVIYSNNLDWHDFGMRSYLKQKTGLTAVMGNDANVAALGEVQAGGAKGAQSAVIITLGTGLGSGVVLDGQILTGYTGAASEIGHMIIQDGGVPCTCGRSGCLESYASATALIRMTREAIAQNPQSCMAALAAGQGTVNGRTSFDAMREGCATGQAVVNQYIHYLAVGLSNVINIFYPEVICLSGGISKEGETLLAPLREKTYALVYGGMDTNRRYTRIEACTLGHKAGLIGAAMLPATAKQ